MNLNKDLYNAIQNHGGVQSSVPTAITDALDQASNCLIDLNSSPLNTMDSDRLENATTNVSTLIGKLINLEDHVDEQVDQALHYISIGKMAKRITAELTDQEESDDDIKIVLGSILEKGENLLIDVSVALSNLSERAKNFQSNNIHRSNLDQATTVLQQVTTEVADQIIQEKTKLDDMQKVIGYLSDTYNLESLSTDPQCSVLIQQLLPNSITQHI